MKKIVLMILAAAIIVSASPITMAEETQSSQIEQQQLMQPILESVKSRVEIPEECSEFSSGTSEQYGYTTFSFLWYNEDRSKSVSIDCGEDGIIMRYSISGFTEERLENPSISTISTDEVKSIAEDFVNKINPDFPYDVVVESENGNLFGGQTAYLATYVNGVKFDDGNGNIGVDRNTGAVTNFSLNYVPCEFPSVDNAIDKETAKKAYSEKLGLELVYRTYTDEDGTETAYPVYTQRNDYGKYIDALTGELININSYGEANKNSASGGATMEMMADSSALTEQELKEIENVKGLIPKEEVENLIKGNEYLGIPADMTSDSITLRKMYNKDNEYTYSVSLSNEKESAYATINAKTGEILSYSRYIDSESEPETKNDEIVKAFAGEKFDEYRYDEESKTYQRYVNDIIVENDSISVQIKDGVLTRYNIAYSQCEFPGIEDAMSKEDAEKIMFDNTEYNIMYKLVYGDKTRNIVSVYNHENVNINPFTGKFVDYRNEEIKPNESSIAYSDIDGHYAEDYIKTLAEYGIGFEGTEFRPDEKITQKDFLGILSTVYSSGIIIMKNNSEQADYVYSMASNRSIISPEERDDDAYVTRDSAAVYMIRAMGAEEYAKYEDIYVSPFKDVTEHKGYVALLNAMGVVNGDGNNNFDPDREITRAESAVMIYNYLTR